MKHFKKDEFKCKCCGVSIVDVELGDVLDDVRENFNAPTIITSGYRCAKHNKEVGGALNSQHMQGIASDIQVKGFTPKQVHTYLTEKYPNKYGIGLYKNWVHIDVRETKARWNG